VFVCKALWHVLTSGSVTTLASIFSWSLAVLVSELCFMCWCHVVWSHWLSSFPSWLPSLFRIFCDCKSFLLSVFILLKILSSALWKGNKKVYPFWKNAHYPY
jgi:hypothetical protein